MNIQTALKLASTLSSDSPRLDVELMLAHVLKKSRTYLFTWPEKDLTAQQESEFQTLMARRQAGEPVAYLLGEQGFWSLKLKVNNTTLIPRPETELLVESAMQKLQGIAQPAVLDLGTGTGAIGLAIASELALAGKQAGAVVHAVDRVQAAVDLAQENAKANQLTWVHCYKSHWFDRVNDKYHVIVSNPPYIDANDPHLTQGDVRYEPSSALVAEQCGLADIQTIIQNSQNYLKLSGWLMLEHGWQQGPDVRRLMRAAQFNKVQSVTDLNGVERVTLGEYLGE